MPQVTIRDVAAVAGVSPATVSRVLNGDPRVAKPLAEKVHGAASRLGYRPNRQARSLRTRATTVLGLIISDIQNPFFTAIVRGVEDAASARGFSVVLANADEDLEKEQRYLEVAAAERMAGVVLSPATATRTHIDVLNERHIPLVTIDRRIRTAAVDSVTINNREAARQAVTHLIEQGCHRIGMVTGRQDVSSAEDRLAGYRDALRTAGLPVDPDLSERGEYRVEGGHTATLRLLSRTPRPDGLFVANNLMTVGALAALGELGLAYPDDVALAGFDDMSWAGLGPPLTLVEQPTYEIGRTATELLMRRITGEDFDVQDVVLPASLRIRRSSLRAGGGEPAGALIA
jgi:LacI family transcriptional regulator